MEKNAIFDNIMARTSVRSYTSQTIEEEKIDMLLRAGMAAPSACNKQPWHFIAITNRVILDQIPSFSPYASMVKQAPLAIVGCDKSCNSRKKLSKYSLSPKFAFYFHHHWSDGFAFLLAIKCTTCQVEHPPIRYHIH